MNIKTGLLTLAASALFVGCKTSITIHESVTIKGSKEAATFIIDCAKAANPMSDEEGEDLVAGCESTAESLFGTVIYYAWVRNYRICYRENYKDSMSCAVDFIKVTEE